MAAAATKSTSTKITNPRKKPRSDVTHFCHDDDDDDDEKNEENPLYANERVRFLLLNMEKR